MARYEINESVTEPRAVFGTDLSTVQAAVPKNGAPVVARDAGTTTSRALYAAASGGSQLTQPILTVNGRIEAYVEGETPVDLLINYGLSNQYTQRFTPPQVGPAGPTGPAGAAGTSGGSTAVGAKFYRDTFGTFDQAVVGSFVGNRTSAPTTQVMGTADASATNERGSVGVYVDNATRNPNSTVNSTSTTFTATTVTFGAGIDLTGVLAGMIVDAGTTVPYVSGFVQSVSGQTVTVNSWRQSGASASTPSSGTRAYINRQDQIWAINANVWSENASDGQAVVGMELGVKVARDDSTIALANSEGAGSRGYDVIALSSAGKPLFGVTARGRFKYGYSASGMIQGSDGKGAGFVYHKAHQFTGGSSVEAAFLDDDSNALVGFKKRAAAGTDATFAAFVGAEASPRFWFDAGGKHSWGDGTTIDVVLERVNSKRLRSDGAIGYWGVTPPAAKPAAPSTLADVIALVQSYGMSA